MFGKGEREKEDCGYENKDEENRRRGLPKHGIRKQTQKQKNPVDKIKPHHGFSAVFNICKFVHKQFPIFL
jgi:hypothetical protein